jgi:hypothetical protein
VKSALHRCLLWLALSVTALAQQTAPAARSGFRISGRVVNAMGGQVLSQVMVTISSADNPDETRQATSDEDGHFAFDHVAPCKYAMSGQRRGFAQQSYQEHEYYSTAVAVGPGLISENLVFQLSPDASISGAVTDEQNEPVRNGHAMLFKSGLLDGMQSIRPWGQLSLDDSGRYRFDHLSPGKYYVAVQARPWYAEYAQASPQRVVVDGGATGQEHVVPEPVPNPELDVAYALTYYPQATEASGAALITLAPGDRAVADIALTVVPAVHARVINLADTGNVILFQTTFDGSKFPTFADTLEVSPGTVEVSGVAPGHFILNLQSPNGEGSIRQDREVELAGGEQIDARQRLASIASISGVVHLENSKTLPDRLFLRFRDLDSGETFGTPLSDKGEFEIRHDLGKPSTFEVALVNQDGTTAIKSITATGAKVVGHSLSLTGGTNAKLDILISRGLGKIDGIVLREGKPQSQAMVLLIPQDLENNRVLVRRDQSDSDGTFALANVVPGRYTAVAIQNGWNLEWANPAVLTPYLKDGEPIEITTARTYQLKLKSQ